MLRIGDSVERFEDARLLCGRGRFVDDLPAPGQARLAVLRSPHAHARIRAIRTDAAATMPGVLAVATGSDLECFGTFSNRIRRTGADGKPMFEPPRRVLAVGTVRYVGEPVAAVVAEDSATARDALEQIEVEYEPLAAIASIEAAIAPGAGAVWPEAPGNIAFVFDAGHPVETQGAFESARHVVRLDVRVNRVSAQPIEPRAALAFYDPDEARFTLYASIQTPHGLRDELSRIARIPANRLRVVAPDVGGAFGMKSNDYAEYALVLWAARRTGRPVRWTGDRSDSFVGDHHARDNLWQLALAMDDQHRFLAVQAESYANLGAYLAYAGTHQATNNVGSLAGVYATPYLHVRVRGVYTNTASVSPYRGAGRPEALYAMERLIDRAAEETGIDRMELRRRNLIAPQAMPFKTGLVFTYDSGDFPRALERILAEADWAGFEKRRAESSRRGRLRGIGFAFAIEIAGGPIERPFDEHAEARVDAQGGLTLFMGTHSHGQGHETSFRQIASETFGIAAERIRVVYGDTDQVAFGRGTFGSRSMSSGGAALTVSANRLLGKARAIAGQLLEAHGGDIQLVQGRFQLVGTDRSVAWEEVAAAAYQPGALPPGMELGLNASAIVSTSAPTFPNSAHVCEVEIDPETGAVGIPGYWVVDDVGRVINPMLLYGQIHGGVVQGLGQVLGEDMHYDDQGQLLTGSFMDYFMPRADQMPAIAVHSEPVPTKANPLGVKGAGEAGVVGALPAAMNAIVDALKPYGVRQLDLPCTPEKIWNLVNSGKRTSL